MKSRRQEEIIDIITRQEVETQEQLLDLLKSRGITTTQATVSRDIKQLHLIKELTPSGVYKYAPSQSRASAGLSGRLNAIFKEGVISFDVAKNLVVLKTMPGLANAAAAAIDSMDIPEMVGSLAGDDTVLLIMRTNEDAADFCRELQTMVQ